MSHVFDLDVRLDLPPGEVTALLGGKAANLAIMALDLGLPVPPAFTISTAACNAYLAGGWPDSLDAEIRQHLATIERRVGRRFGDPADPLLVAVRSGAPVSMPGMMDTILNLGLNDATTRGLADVSASPEFAADCRRRLEGMFRDVAGIERVPDDPWVQLRAAIEAVFQSWNSDRARTYRRHDGIPEVLGTAVTIQAMVFGNRGLDSGSGVLFTRNPVSGEQGMYGDVMFDAQGEDVVAGSHRTDSLSELAVRLPSVGAELERFARVLERHHADLCDIEFTIERGRLWLLQCRIGKRSPQAALRMAVDMAEDATFPLTRAAAVERVAGLLAEPPVVSSGRDKEAVPIARGLPASPGLVTGEIAITPDEAIALAEAGRSVILVRSETSPDDVHGMARASGILTTVGGVASHAAVVARGWGIPAVVGASTVRVSREGVSIGGQMLGPGSPITIDGSTGEIFDGVVAGRTSIMPEAETLRGWARELGIPIRSGSRAAEANGASPGAVGSGDARTVGPDDILSCLSIRGYGTAAGLAEALLAMPEGMSALLDGLVAHGLVEPAVGSFRLTRAGRDAADHILAADRDRWGVDRAARALDAFLDLDRQMKDTVTAWQLRDAGGTAVPNDHADPAYDAAVLDRLGALHTDALGWLRPIAGSPARYRTYADRLGRAAQRAADGDARYVASPRVDSYHGIWFELHEDLIRMAGRTRADEVAAGRA